MALTITVVRQYLDWPLGQTINQEDLKQQLGVHAMGSNGADLTDKVLFNLTQVNINQQGEYPVVLSVMDATGQTAQTSVTLDVRPMRTQPTQPTNPAQVSQPTNPAGPKKHRGWLWGLIAVIVIICLLWGWSSHRRQQQSQAVNNSQQSSQIADNSSSVAKLSGDNQKLANQVAELRGAVKQYQHDKDQAALNQRLDKIESQNQQLTSQVSNGTQSRLNQVTNVVEQVRQDPDNGVQIVNDLKNESGFKDIWNNITNMVQGWMDKFAE
ncbi:MAG: hypothetical protein ACI4T4_01255 [Limosilactobacillus sp.]